MDWGCLLIHAFGGSPFEMALLAAAVEQVGGVARCVTLPGHDSSFAAFRKTNFTDWAAHAEQEYLTLTSEVEHVMVAGFSMGGTLALHIAAKYSPAALVSIAAPIHVYRIIPWEMKDWRLPFVRIMRFVRPVWPGAARSELQQDIAPWNGYTATALPQLWSLMKGARIVGSQLADIRCPVLVVHAVTDKTVPVSNAWRILSSVCTAHRELHLLSIHENQTSHHMLTTHSETREHVAGLVQSFAKRIICTKM